MEHVPFRDEHATEEAPPRPKSKWRRLNDYGLGDYVPNENDKYVFIWQWFHNPSERARERRWYSPEPLPEDTILDEMVKDSFYQNHPADRVGEPWLVRCTNAQRLIQRWSKRNSYRANSSLV